MRALFLALIFLFSDLNAEEIRLLVSLRIQKLLCFEPDKPFIDKKDDTWNFDLLIDKLNKKFCETSCEPFNRLWKFKGTKKIKNLMNLY